MCGDSRTDVSGSHHRRRFALGRPTDLECWPDPKGVDAPVTIDGQLALRFKFQSPPAAMRRCKL